MQQKNWQLKERFLIVSTSSVILTVHENFQFFNFFNFISTYV